jgi:hypothetical protein
VVNPDDDAANQAEPQLPIFDNLGNILIRGEVVIEQASIYPLLLSQLLTTVRSLPRTS